MMTLEDLTHAVHAVYEHFSFPSRYEFLGSSFTVGFGDRFFLVTAGHVVAGKKMTALRFLDHAGVLKKLYFKAVDIRGPKPFKDDLGILEINTEPLDVDGLYALGALALSRQSDHQFSDLPRNTILFTKGYPRERGQVDNENLVLTNLPFETDGRYPRAEKEEPGITLVEYYEDDEPKVRDCDGMYGSPWIVGDCLEEGWQGMLAGVHVAGISSEGIDKAGIFIRSEVLIERLREI